MDYVQLDVQHFWCMLGNDLFNQDNVNYAEKQFNQKKEVESLAGNPTYYIWILWKIRNKIPIEQKWALRR